jgi:hypothetical protein
MVVASFTGSNVAASGAFDTTENAVDIAKSVVDDASALASRGQQGRVGAERTGYHSCIE